MTVMWFDKLHSVKAFMGNDYDVSHVPAPARPVGSQAEDPYVADYYFWKARSS